MTKRRKITADYFRKATGRKPEQDDLERCNCELAGRTFHMMCGWDWERDLPNFWPTTRVPNAEAAKPD